MAIASSRSTAGSTNLRWPIAEATTHAIAADLPLGVGLGAFEPIYQMFESPAATLPAYVNHAHDDWLELVLDGGLPALALMLAFLLSFARASVRIRREPPRTGRAVDRALARAGTIVIGLFLLHSTVDYPLRTTSLMVVFAFAAALMIPPAETNERERPAKKIAAAPSKIGFRFDRMAAIVWR